MTTTTGLAHDDSLVGQTVRVPSVTRRTFQTIKVTRTMALDDPDAPHSDPPGSILVWGELVRRGTLARVVTIVRADDEVMPTMTKRRPS